jgi:hypothetical protein
MATFGELAGLESTGHPKQTFREYAEEENQRRIFSGGPLMDVLDIVAVPGYAEQGALQAYQRAVEKVSGRKMFRGKAKWNLKEFRATAAGFAAMPAGALRGIQRRASFGDVLRQEAPGFVQAHPTAAAALTMAGDIATFPAGATNEVLGGVARVARPLVRGAGATLTRAIATRPEVIPRGVGGIEFQARRIGGATAVPAQALAERIAAQEPRVAYLQRGVEQMMDEVYASAPEEAVSQVKRLRTAALQERREATRQTARAKVFAAQAEDVRLHGPTHLQEQLGKRQTEYNLAQRQAVETQARYYRALDAYVADVKPDPELVARSRDARGVVDSLVDQRKRLWNRIDKLESGGKDASGVRAAENGLATQWQEAIVRWQGLETEITETRKGLPSVRSATFARADEAHKAMDRAIRQEVSAAGRARGVEGAIGEATGYAAPVQRGEGPSPSGITPSIAEPTVAAPVKEPGPVQNAVERFRSKSNAAITAAEEATARMEMLVEHAQELGARRGQVLARRLPGLGGMNRIRDIASQGAINTAQAGAEEWLDGAISRLRKVAGNDVGDEVAGLVREIQYRAMRRAVTGSQYGVLVPEQLARYGKYHLWRGFEMYSHPEEFIARIRAADPELAATLEAQNATRRAFQTGRGGGIPRVYRESREALPLTVKRELGELPIAERFAVGERTAAVAAGEGYRLQQFAGRWGMTERQFTRLSPAKQRWYTKVPETDRWGPLKDVPYVPKWLAAHLGFNMEGAGWQNLIARLVSWGLPARAGEVSNTWTNHIMGTWKYLHTAGNLPTAFRNITTNAAMTYLVGKIPSYHVPGYLARGALSVLRRDASYGLAAKVNPGFRATFTSTELRQLRNLAVGGDEFTSTLQKIAARPARVYRGMGNAYEFAEQSAKMAVFLYHTDMGMKPSAAAKLAMQAIFDYGDVSRALNWARRYGVWPFGTYPVKATKALIPAMVESPQRFAAVSRAIQAPSAVLPPEERGQIEASMRPEESGALMPLTFRTKQGERLVLDVGYTVPWGPWAQTPSILDTMPLPRIAEDIARNQSSFTKKEIYSSVMPADVRVLSIADYVWSSLGPGWIVRGIPKIVATQRPRARWSAPAEQVSTGRTLRTITGELAGVKVQPYLPAQMMAGQSAELDTKLRELSKVQDKMGAKFAAGEITEGDYRRLLDTTNAQAQLFIEDFAKRGRAYAGAGKP